MQSTLRQELEHAGARPASSDAVEELGEVIEGVYPAQSAVERESQQRCVPRTGVRSPDVEAVLSHERDCPQQTLDVRVRDGRDPVLEKRREPRLLAFEVERRLAERTLGLTCRAKPAYLVPQRSPQRHRSKLSRVQPLSATSVPARASEKGTYRENEPVDDDPTAGRDRNATPRWACARGVAADGAPGRWQLLQQHRDNIKLGCAPALGSI